MDNSNQEGSLLKKSVEMNCELHGAYTGFQIQIANLGFLKNSVCPVCKEIKQARRKESEEKELSEEFRRKVESSGISRRYRHLFIEDIGKNIADAESEIQSNYNENILRINFVKHYFESFNPSKAENLLITGNTSLGKTHTACALGVSLIKKGFSVQYVNTSEMFALQKEIMFDREKSESDYLSKLTSAKLLIVDEFGIKELTDHEKTFLNSIINGRYENMLPTVFIGNISKEMFYKKIGERATRRLLENMMVLNFVANVSSEAL